MAFPLTAARLEQIYAMQDALEAAGDRAGADAKQSEWEALLDAAKVAVPCGPVEIGQALDLAAHIASASAGKLVDRCVRRNVRCDYRLLAALRKGIGACRDDIDASHVRPIVGNCLHALTRLRVV